MFRHIADGYLWNQQKKNNNKKIKRNKEMIIKVAPGFKVVIAFLIRDVQKDRKSWAVL